MRQIIIISSSIKVTSALVAQGCIAHARLMMSGSIFHAFTRSYLGIRRLTTAITVHFPHVVCRYHNALFALFSRYHFYNIYIDHSILSLIVLVGC